MHHTAAPSSAPRHRSRGWHRVIVALAALGLLAAACGSASDGNSSKTDGKGSSGANAQAVPIGKPLTSAAAAEAAEKLLGPIEYATGSTTRGINGKVITIGGVADVTDAAGLESYEGVCDGAKARFKRANEEGGVNGYTFKYVGCEDTGSTPDGSKSKTRDLVENQKVFALVPKTSPAGSNATYLNEEHVPYFGWGVDSDFCGWSDKQFGFSVTGSVACGDVLKGKTFFSSVGLDTYTKGLKQDPADQKWAFIASNDDQSRNAIAAFDSIATDEGATVAFKTTAVPSQGSPPLSDYAPLAQQIVASGANAVYMIVPPNAVFALAPALRAAGYAGDIILPFADHRLLAVVDSIDQAYAETANMGSAAFPSEAFTQMTADLKAIGSKAPADGLGSVTSYAGADLFIQALGKVQGPLTAEKLAKVINEGFTYEPLGNITCETVWPGSHAVPGNCSALLQFSAKKEAILPLADLTETGHVYLFENS